MVAPLMKYYCSCICINGQYFTYEPINKQLQIDINLHAVGGLIYCNVYL